MIHMELGPSTIVGVGLALIGFVLYLLLSSNTAFKILNLIISTFINHIEIINEQKEPSFIAKLIMAIIIAIILFIF